MTMKTTLAKLVLLGLGVNAKMHKHLNHDHDHDIVMSDKYDPKMPESESNENSSEWISPDKRRSKCFGLALSDATFAGPFQAGAMIGLLKEQQEGQEYQVITGVGNGAVNGYIMALHDQQTERTKTIQELRDFWM